MGKKEKKFPLTTIGGRIQALRHKLGYFGDDGKEEFYDFVYSDEPTEKNIQPESKQKNISNWERKGVTVPILKKICKKCNCSSDYLLGIEKEKNHDLHFICNYTGLSEDAVNILHKQKKSYFPIGANTINFFLEDDKNLNDKLELWQLIVEYILLTKNTKSYNECDVPRMENSNIALCDEYGTSTGNVSIDKMSNIVLLSINELLFKLKDNIPTKHLMKKPTIFDILNNMLVDLICIEEIKKDIIDTVKDGSIGIFCFDIDNLSRMNRRFDENKKRLIYLYDCATIDDIDFKEFQSVYSQYSDSDIKLLKDNLNL